MNKEKIVFVSDIHGRDFYKKIFEKFPDHGKIFVGDYWDFWDLPYLVQESVYNDIIQLKRKDPENIVLLLGNHIFYYLKSFSYLCQNF